MKKIFATFFIVFFAQTILFSQENFPESWFGTYRGTMYIYKQAEGLKDSLDVKLEILPDSVNRWVYRMTYKSLKIGEVIKDYFIVKPDSLPENAYLLDEKDGIYILQTYMDNCLYASFSVAGNYINSIIRKSDDTIYFEIFSSSTKESLKSQNEAKEGQVIFTVRSFPPFTTQKAILRKVKN